MVTIADVAKRAGVSKMTVSRVINGSGYISQETRERVEKAIQELDYVPNSLARSLRFKRTRTIGLILTDITNPFFTTLARGVEDAASEHGFSVIFCNTDESAEEESRYVNVLTQKQVDGLLLVPTARTPESITFLENRNLPFVLLDRRVPDFRVDVVRCDSEQGAHDLVYHLLSLGHQRIAALGGSMHITSSTDRIAGYRRALREAGLEHEAHRAVFSSFTIEGGFSAANKALTMQPPPTALFAANNFIAIGAFRALREAGLRVPQDISLVSFDDLPMSVGFDPFLTIIEQPAYEMGHRATQLLLERLSQDGPGEPQDIILPVNLIVRVSSAPPAAG
ncbi:MAG: LacI family DNA-binding transcriptional regulator [Chloroflexi bacterium]|nr:LacI family DNA-binding transcriptional regulator [Chloroflexota bacterium]